MASCLIAFLLVLNYGPAIAQDSDAFQMKNDPLKKAGPLKNISDVQELFKLKTVGTRLDTEILSTYQEAQAAVSQIRSKTRSGGGSSSSGATWMAYFQGNEFFGYVATGKTPQHMIGRFPNMAATNQNSNFTISFKELKTPQRELEITVDEDNVFSISLRSSELGYLFRFRQEKSGRVVCQEMSSEFVFARSAKSFDSFAKQNPGYVHDRLMQVFDFMGVGKPPTRFSSIVRNQVLLMLRPIDPERMAEFKKAVKDMSATSYKVREAATAEIDKKFEEWQDLIKIGMGDEDFAAETRTRLNKIYGSKVDKSTKQLMKLAQESRLQSDIEYLIWAMMKTEEEADKRLFADQLASVTSEDFGTDATQWTDWFVKTNEVETTVKTEVDLEKIEAQKGPMDTATPFVTQLAKFKIESGSLQLDREHWAAQFEDKPIAESVKEVEALMRERNLPLKWLDAGDSHTLESTEYPQVIFANMVEKLEAENKQPPNQTPTYGYMNQPDSSSRNRTVMTSEILAEMQFHKSTDNARMGRFVAPGRQPAKAPPAKYFSLYFKEHKGPKRVFEIYEAANKSVSITLISDDADAVIRFFQQTPTTRTLDDEKEEKQIPGKCVIYDIRGEQTREIKADSFQDLVGQNREYFEKEWVPLMAKFGLAIEGLADKTD